MISAILPEIAYSLAIWVIWPPKLEASLTETSKGTFLHGKTLLDELSVKIGATLWALASWKNPQTKKKLSKDNFTHIRVKNTWTKLREILHSGRVPRRSYPSKVGWWSVWPFLCGRAVIGIEFQFLSLILTVVLTTLGHHRAGVWYIGRVSYSM